MKNLMGVLVSVALLWGAWAIYRSKNPPGPTGAVGSNMRSVVRFLESLPQAQEQFRQQNLVDQDSDGMGEFGFLQELAGSSACRVSKLSNRASPFVAAIAGLIDKRGHTNRSNFLCVIYLPSKSGTAFGANPRWKPGPSADEEEGTRSDPAPFPDAPADADAQEQRWACYAWDTGKGHRTGTAYFVNQDGKVWRTNMEQTKYSGSDLAPPPNAAFAVGSPSGANLDGKVGENGTSNDGNTWTPSEGW